MPRSPFGGKCGCVKCRGRCCGLMFVWKVTGGNAGSVTAAFNGKYGGLNASFTDTLFGGGCGGTRVYVLRSDLDEDANPIDPYCSGVVADLVTTYGVGCVVDIDSYTFGDYSSCICGMGLTLELAVTRSEASATIAYEIYRGCAASCTLVASGTLALTTSPQNVYADLPPCCTCCSSSRQFTGPSFGVGCVACGSCAANDNLEMDVFGADLDPVATPAASTSDLGAGITISSPGNVSVRIQGTSYSSDGCDGYLLFSDVGEFTIDVTDPPGKRVCGILVEISGAAFGTRNDATLVGTDTGGNVTQSKLSVTTSAYTPCSLSQPQYGYQSAPGTSVTQFKFTLPDPSGMAIGAIRLCTVPA